MSTFNSFKDQSWQNRVNTLGDIAESKYEETAKVSFERYGLNRPAVSLRLLPLMIRHTPDYLTSHGLVEVQGFGRSQLCHMKLDKLDALKQWNKVFPVDLFWYDSLNDRTCQIPLKDFIKLIKNAQIKTFPEGHEYYAVPAESVWESAKTS